MANTASVIVAKDLLEFLDLRKRRIQLQKKGEFVNFVLMFVGKRTAVGLSTMSNDRKLDEFASLLNIDRNHAEYIFEYDSYSSSGQDLINILLFSNHCYHRSMSIRSLSPILKRKYGPFGYLNSEFSEYRFEYWLFDEGLTYTSFG